LPDPADDCEERSSYDDGQIDAARTWLTWRPQLEADDRMRAQRAVPSMARVQTDHPTRPDTELQSDPSSTPANLAFPGKSIQRLGIGPWVKTKGLA